MNWSKRLNAFENRFALTYGLELIPGASVRYLPVYLTFLGISPVLSASLLSAGYVARLLAIPLSFWFAHKRYSAAVGGIMFGVGILMVSAGLHGMYLFAAVTLIYLGRQISSASTMAVLLSTPAASRHKVTTQAFGMMAIHRNITGPALLDFVYSLSWTWVWMTSAVTTFVISLLRIADAPEINSNISSKPTQTSSLRNSIGLVFLLATAAGFIILEEVWIPRFLSEARLSLSWFFFPYFLSSQAFRFLSATKEAFRQEHVVLGIGVVAFSSACVLLTLSVSIPAVAMAGIFSGIAGAATTPLFLMWLSDKFSTQAASVSQLIGAIAYIFYASLLGVSGATLHSYAPGVVLALFFAGLMAAAIQRKSSKAAPL